MFPGDLPRQDHPLPKALDGDAAAKLLRAAHNDNRLLVTVAPPATTSSLCQQVWSAVLGHVYASVDSQFID
jgi:hypothetical protein